MYNEEEAVEEFHRRVSAVMKTTGRDYEMVFVDDGSSDGTLDALKKVAADDSHVSVVEFRRNFGQTPALQAGFDYSRGDVVIAMDGDLENVPEDIPKFLEHIDEGYDIISGWRKNREHGLLLRRIPSKVANWLMCRLSGVKLHDTGCTFKAYRRETLDHVRLYGEMHRFVPALASLAGARILEIEVQHVDRPYGASKYGIGRAPRVFLDLLLLWFLRKYSTRPMHLFGQCGLVLFLLAGLTGAGLVVAGGCFDVQVFGQYGALVVAAVLFLLVGVICILGGFLAEILARSRHESTGKRIYAVRKVHRIARNGD